MQSASTLSACRSNFSATLSFCWWNVRCNLIEHPVQADQFRSRCEAMASKILQLLQISSGVRAAMIRELAMLLAGAFVVEPDPVVEAPRSLDRERAEEPGFWFAAMTAVGFAAESQ
ncbi:MAG: hypothetical protein ACREQD_08260 [Candidatus Binataceae bacterium]